MRIYLSGAAQQDIKEIYRRGYLQFGETIADNYDTLIAQAFSDLVENPRRLGTKVVPGKEDGLYEYHIKFSKSRAQSQIKKPRHIVLYYILKSDNALVIARVIREGRELERSLVDRVDTLEDLDSEA